MLAQKNKKEKKKKKQKKTKKKIDEKGYFFKLGRQQRCHRLGSENCILMENDRVSAQA